MSDKRTFYMRTDQARESAIALIRNLPLDDKKPMMVVVQAYKAERKLSQQALLFAGPMRDISEQAWFGGRQYSVEVLHEMCKREFLPEGYDDEQCKDGYIKWGVDPLGNRILVGSTTQLTVKGYSTYLEQVFAFGAEYGVQFSEKEIS